MVASNVLHVVLLINYKILYLKLICNYERSLQVFL